MSLNWLQPPHWGLTQELPAQGHVIPQLRACRGHCQEPLASILSRRPRISVTSSLQHCLPCQYAGGCLKESLTGTVGAYVAQCPPPKRGHKMFLNWLTGAMHCSTDYHSQ